MARLSRDLGVPLARRNVRVNAPALGPVRTHGIAATFPLHGGITVAFTSPEAPA